MNEKQQLRNVQDFYADIQKVLQKHGFMVDDLIGINVVISNKHDKPAVFLRRNTTDPELIKTIIKSAYHNQPLIIMPQFTNTLQSLSTAVEKGILYQKNGEYVFTF